MSFIPLTSCKCCFLTLPVTLSNAGTVNWSGAGRLAAYTGCVGGGPALVNTTGGVFNVLGDGRFELADCLSPGCTLTNYGTLRKAGSAGTNELYFAFYNLGAVDVQSGALRFWNGFSQTVGDTRLAGGSLGGGTF